MTSLFGLSRKPYHPTGTYPRENTHAYRNGRQTGAAFVSSLSSLRHGLAGSCAPLLFVVFVTAQAANPLHGASAVHTFNSQVGSPHPSAAAVFQALRLSLATRNAGGAANKESQGQGAPAPAGMIATVTPDTGGAGTKVTIKGSGFGNDTDGKSTVKFGGTVVNVAHGNWTDTEITLTAPDLGVAGEPNKVDISIQDGGGKVLASSAAAFTETASTWGDKDERPLDIKFVGGYEEGFQSSQAATSDAFLAIYGRRLFHDDHFGPYFAVRLQTAPQASGTYNVISVFSNPTGTISSSNLNSVGSAVDLSTGMELQFSKFDQSRTTLSLIAGTGFITPLQSNTISATFTMPAFGTVECTELQGRLAEVLSGPNYKGIVPNTAAGSASCFSNTLNANNTSTPPVPPAAVTLLEYAVPNTPNFFPKYSAGFRIVNRYAGTSNGPTSCLESSPCERGYVDFTIGQSAALTSGTLKHTVFTIDSIHPLPVPNINFLYLFGSASMRFYHLPQSVSPLVLQTGTATTAPSAGTLVIPLTQPDRDFYRIGVGVNIAQIFTALTGNSKTNQSAGQAGNP